ncbi:MAG: hypothetical protein NZ742_01975 [Acidobacteria bacterium]|nr:hypothetical protein [Acidobacteriota bacterium]MDW7983409.1 hypothetical protein [Acidobacteriota bacterium]
MRWVYWLTIVLALLLPFETVRPLVRPPGFVFTSLELVAVAAVETWGLARMQDARSKPRLLERGHPDAGRNVRDAGKNVRIAIWRRGLDSWKNLTPPRPWAVFLLTAVGSALGAPAYSGAALKFVGRWALGVAVFLMTVEMAQDERRVSGLLRALIAGAGVSVPSWAWESLWGRPSWTLG